MGCCHMPMYVATYLLEKWDVAIYMCIWPLIWVRNHMVPYTYAYDHIPTSERRCRQGCPQDISWYLKIFKYVWRHLGISEDISNIQKYLQLSSKSVNISKYLETTLLGLQGSPHTFKKGYLEYFQISLDFRKYFQISRDNLAGLAKHSSGYLKIFEDF